MKPCRKARPLLPANRINVTSAPVSDKIIMKAISSAHPEASNRTLLDRLIKGRLAFVIVIGLATFFWWPSIWNGQILLHGDSAHLFLQMFSLQSQALSGDGTQLWTTSIYGGHPIFAEGQGGFANPLNMICALLFESNYGIGVLHWLCMIIGGTGIYRLCRLIDIARWPSIFACISVLFSTSWINSYHNIAMSVTLAWAPWFIVAAERWLRKPSALRAAALAITVALLITAGYPQITYATIVFFFISIMPKIFFREDRRFLLANTRALTLTGTLAIILAILISAVQLIPLLELALLSHRNSGIGLLFPGLTSPAAYLKGLALPNYWGMTASLGSSLTILILAGIFFARPNSRVLGYALGSFILFNLGMEYASPLFAYIYEHKLMPGLHSFRVTHLFFSIAIIGISVVSAYALDRLAKHEARSYTENKFKRKILFVCGSLVIFSIVTALSKHYIGSLSVAISIFCISAITLFAANKLRWLPLIAVFLISTKSILLYRDVFSFYPTEVLRAPPAIERLIDAGRLKDFKTHIRGTGGVFVFIPPNSPDLEAAYIRYVSSLSPQAGMQWEISSIDGTLALPLSRWAYAYDQILKDIPGHDESKIGSRLLDILGVRFISFDNPVSVQGLSLFYKDEGRGIFIYENEMAKPRFQIYKDAIITKSPAESILAINRSMAPCLVIEDSDNTTSAKESGQCLDAGEVWSRIKIKEDRPTRYQLEITVNQAAWLFIADANYPGWIAHVNGNATPVKTAQILGKSIKLEAGTNHVDIEFAPKSLYIGLILSLIGLGTSLAIYLFNLKKIITRKHKEPHHV